VGKFEDIFKSENGLEGIVSINISDVNDMLMASFPAVYNYQFSLTFEGSGQKVTSAYIHAYKGPDGELGVLRTRVKAYQKVMAVLKLRKGRADTIQVKDCDTCVGPVGPIQPYVAYPETVEAAQKRLARLEKNLTVMEKKHKDYRWV
jgi:hypothetical protein